MPIVPDDKNWTWVLDEVCPECGFDTSAFPREEVAPRIREQGAIWAGLLAGPGAAARTREDRWSTLEYGCHVRDVFRLYDVRLGLMLDEDNPIYANWDQDATAIESRYHEQDPAAVATELGTAAEALATRFDGVDGQRWGRLGRRSDGATFTVESFARYLLHDPVHHVWDVTAGGMA